MNRRTICFALLVAGCGRGSAPGSSAGSAAGSASSAGSAGSASDAGSGSAAAAPANVTCTELPFEATTSVPEASGAAWMMIDGKAALVVVSDSGNHGAYGVVDPDSGKTIETGTLPLGPEGEDLEGAAERDGKLVAITSSGWIRVWKRAANGFDLVEAAYPIGPVDLPAGKQGIVGDKPPAGNGMVCPGSSTNCGRNYEGLCLAPKIESAKSRCVGFVAAKADGTLYCLVDKAGKLAVDAEGAVKIARPGVVADCAFADDGRLFAGSNLFDLGHVYEVRGWQEPKTAKVVGLGAMGVGFPETLAVKGDVFYRMSDLGEKDPSAMKKYRCK